MGEDSRNFRADLRKTQTNHHSAPSSLYFIRTVAKSLQENPGSIQAVSFLVRTQALGLSILLTENGVYPGIFRPLRYHSSCISTMSIPLTLTVLERTLEAVIVLYSRYLLHLLSI